MKIQSQSWEDTKRGSGANCVCGETPCVHMEEKGRRYQKCQFIVESLVVVGRCRMAVHDRGEEGIGRDLKACVIIAKSQSGKLAGSGRPSLVRR